MARQRAFSSFKEKLALLTFHVRKEVNSGVVTRQNFPLKVECVVRRAIAVQKQLRHKRLFTGKQLSNRLSTLSDEAKDSDSAYVGTCMHPATAAP